MLKHVVMFKFKDFAEGADRQENLRKVKAGLEELKNKIGEIKFWDLGVNSVQSQVAYDLILSSEFSDEESLRRYQQHPEHIKVAELVGKVCEHRAVVDYKV
jgi:hypothetical protein